MNDWLLACAAAVPFALAVDLCWGEPPLAIHPVAWMGRFLRWFGERLVRLPDKLAFIGGTMAWWLGACVVAGAALALEMALRWGVAWAMHGDAAPWRALVQAALLGLLLKPMLAWRMLRDEVAGVERALGSGLDQGRAQLQRLVSRDVATLDEAAVRESAIESLAENLNDSVVAPLCWFAVGGLAGAAVYRFANTADAMWGYRGRFEWAGKWAARADDVLSWAPARITALMLCLAAWHWPGMVAMRTEASRTPSPNGGWPMGTMALLLGVRLRKPGVYALNDAGVPPQASHTGQALRLAGVAAMVSAAMWMLSLLAQAYC